MLSFKYAVGLDIPLPMVYRVTRLLHSLTGYQNTPPVERYGFESRCSTFYI